MSLVAAVPALAYGFPAGDGWLEILRQWRTKYFLVETDHLDHPGAFRSQMAAGGIKLLASIAGIDVYDLGG